MELSFRKLASNAKLPTRAQPGDAGLDLSASADAEVAPGARVKIPTGLAVAIPEGFAGLVLPRSGLAARLGLTLANAPGLIDSGYRGEIICAVVNLDSTNSVRINAGDRIAQLVVVEVPEFTPVWADELPETQRGVGGFGSTGSAGLESGSEPEGLPG